MVGRDGVWGQDDWVGGKGANVGAGGNSSLNYRMLALRGMPQHKSRKWLPFSLPLSFSHRHTQTHYFMDILHLSALLIG